MSEKKYGTFAEKASEFDFMDGDNGRAGNDNKSFECSDEKRLIGSNDHVCEIKQDIESRTGRCILDRKTRIYVYISHFLSSWGDRMWSFGVGVFLIELSPDSLRLTASFGFSSGCAVLLFGALLGNWVDNTPRLRAVISSLITQNMLVCACAIAVFFVFYYMNEILLIWPNEGFMQLCQALIIVTAILANLASIVRTIAVEKDWIVEICGRDHELLASMTATLRGINLTTQTLAPVVTGQIMSFTEVYYSAVFIAGWNLVSVVIEYILIKKVYEQVPALQNIKQEPVIKVTEPAQSDVISESSKESSKVQTSDKNNTCLSSFLARLNTISKGWVTYMKYDVAFAGVGLSFLYMTVIGFDNITIGYAYSQGLSESVLGILQAAGALTGILGTFTYPSVRRRIGLDNTGLLGLGAEIICLCFCVASIWTPGSPSDLMPSPSDANVSVVCSNVSATQMSLNSTKNTGSGVAESDTSTKYSIPGSVYEECRATTTTDNNISIWLLMVGIVTARFGLWVFDLAITQMFLQTIEESERGIVNGVQNSLNQSMDMLKFLLVIVLPKPNQFGILILISFSFIILALILY